MTTMKSLMAATFGVLICVPAFADMPPVAAARDSVSPVLINPEGRSLYVREGDIGGRGCSPRCLTDWLPLRAARKDVGPAGWSVIRRPNGSYQWAYRLQPLYTCRKDRAPSAVMCDGAGDGKWHYVQP